MLPGEDGTQTTADQPAAETEPVCSQEVSDRCLVVQVFTGQVCVCAVIKVITQVKYKVINFKNFSEL